MFGNLNTPAQVIVMIEPILTEVFSSIQGEGLYCGCRQIFIRLADCNLSCAYCDTDYTKASLFQLETAPGSGFFTAVENPPVRDVFLPTLIHWLAALPGAHHSFSITGGEPLCQTEALRWWLPQLRELLPVHLETNGTLPAALGPLLPWCDFISMDIKLTSVTSVATPWELHRDFLALATQCACQVKAVIGPKTSKEEVLMVAELMRDIASGVTLILQPLTINECPAVSPQQLLEHQAAAAAVHSRTRIIPQMHRFMALL